MKVRTSFAFVFILLVCTSFGWSFGKSKKQKVIDRILTNPNVAEIVQIKGYDDWETKYFMVKLILKDGTKLWLRNVDFKFKTEKSKDLHFDEIWLMNDFSFVELQFNSKKNNCIGISQFQNPPDDCSPCIYELYKHESFDFLLDHHQEIIEELKKYPVVPEDFINEVIVQKNHNLNDLKKYTFVNFNVEYGNYPVIISSEKFMKW